MTRSKVLYPILLTVLAVSFSQAQVDSNFHCYLLFGQSNMAGGGAVSTAAVNCDTTSRIKVLAFCDCNGSSQNCNRPLNRTRDKWYTSFPPIHICSEGISPGDWFAKTLIDSVRSDIKIGLIPCALSGQALNVFLKGRSNFNIPTWAHPTLGNSSPYTWMYNRCKIAQQTGVIKGILLHQGESGAGDGADWVKMAKGIFDTLKKDLNLDINTPVIVGELRQDVTVSPAPSGGNAGFNANLKKLANEYPSCAVASSAGLLGNGKDVWHFTPDGMTELGKRYAKAFLSLASPDYVPRQGTVSVATPKTPKTVPVATVKSWKDEARIFTLDGKVVPSFQFSGKTALSGVRPGNMYLVTRNNNTGVKLMVVP
ncbi:MAG: sialate O-acetylesterase [Fibrobacter sp.]|nr:sialate O-acetylesterase [Fibrobacter sp.]